MTMNWRYYLKNHPKTAACSLVVLVIGAIVAGFGFNEQSSSQMLSTNHSIGSLKVTSYKALPISSSVLSSDIPPSGTSVSLQSQAAAVQSSSSVQSNVQLSNPSLQNNPLVQSLVNQVSP